MTTRFRVTAMTWRHVVLEIDVCVEPAPPTGAPQARFTLAGAGQEYPLDSRPLSETAYRLSINVTNLHDRSQVPDGVWCIVGHTGDGPGSAAFCDSGVLRAIDAFDRVYLFDRHTASFTVSFGVRDDSDPATLWMYAYRMWRNPGTVASQGLRARARRAFERHARRLLANGLYQLFRRLRRRRGCTILFASDARVRLEGNLIEIRDRMIERGLDHRYGFTYSLRPPHGNSKASTVRVIARLAAADIILLDDYFALLEFLDLSSGTTVIQTWHAGGGFKAFGLSRFGKSDSLTLQNAHRKYTYAITASAQLTPAYAESFGIEASAVVPTGLPRTDAFLDPIRMHDAIAAFRDNYPRFADKRKILFAPTFRGQSTGDAHYDYSRLDLESLHEVCDEDTVILFRMHHYISTPIDIPRELSDKLCDVSSYPDGNGLLHIADVLITDYSSIVYEYSLLNRPMLFFAYDCDVYDAARGFRDPLDDTAPGKICRTMDELLQAIRVEDYEAWKIDRFRRDNFGVLDGHAADRIIDTLIEPGCGSRRRGRGTG